MCGVVIAEEPEDKFQPVLLRIDQPGGSGEAVRLRLADNTHGAAVREALEKAAGS